MKTITAAAAIVSALVPATSWAQDAQYELVDYEDIKWGALNPARGDASPRADDLWGDRTADRAREPRAASALGMWSASPGSVASTLAGLDGRDIEFLFSEGAEEGRGAITAFLWSNDQTGERGSLVHLPNGFAGQIAMGAGSFRAVTTGGGIAYSNPQMPQITALSQGSYFGSAGAARHQIACSADNGCTVYIRTDSAFTLIQ